MIDYRNNPEAALKRAKQVARSNSLHWTSEFQADELEGIAVDALMEALRKDNGSGNFEAFLCRIVRMRIIDYKRKKGPYTRTGRLRALPRARKLHKLKTPQERREGRSEAAKRMWATRGDELRAKFVHAWARLTPAERRERGRLALEGRRRAA